VKRFDVPAHALQFSQLNPTIRPPNIKESESPQAGERRSKVQRQSPEEASCSR
jgi:hypothetical protein